MFSSQQSPSLTIPTITANIYPTSDAVRRDVITIPAATNTKPETVVEIKYTNARVVGNGSFGVVYVAHLYDTNEQIAIKKVLQDKRYKNRELQIMRKLSHQDDLYLNLILEFMPDTVYRMARQYSKQRKPIPMIFVRLYTYQMFRALAYIHSIGICHRDIKPQNLLIDPETTVLKLCDFGSAKFLVRGEPNVSYICSRYYRAPELIFGSTNYTNSIDVWSAGTVLAELMLGHPIFPGDSGVDQLVEIIKLLGTPTREQIQLMNGNYREFMLPSIRAHPWSKVFRTQTPSDAIDLVSKLLEYNPNGRLTPLQACTHSFFDELRNPETRLPNGNPLPPVLEFTTHELTIEPHLNSILLPQSSSQTSESGQDTSSNQQCSGSGGSSGGLSESVSGADCGVAAAVADYHTAEGLPNTQTAAT